MTITVHNHVPREDLALGLVRAEGVTGAAAPAALAEEIEALVAERAGRDLDARQEALRKGSRDMLRNGKYKPTGRGKPASEYLMREAGKDNFPRINGPVDATNLVSLKHCVPISLWDLDLAGDPAEYEVRLGAEDETYVFNAGGQLLGLRDLVCGCALEPSGGSRALVTPIKDSLATKLKDDARRVAGIIYYPLPAGSREHLEQATEEFGKWLGMCGEGVEVGWGVALPGESGDL